MDSTNDTASSFMTQSTDPSFPASTSQDGDAVPLRQRRQSSPMMPAFMVSAPGKVIVFGEHAVVHGKVSYPFLTDR
jgi:hypothetical protein